jgi:hypothetical protein
MKRSLLLAIFAMGFGVSFTTTIAQSKCGTILYEKDSSQIDQLPWIGNNDLLVQFSQTNGSSEAANRFTSGLNGGVSPANYRIPVQATIVHLDDGSLGIEEFEADQYIRMVNNAHLAANTGIQFYLICNPVHFNNTFFSTQIGSSFGLVRADTLFSLIDTEGAIDLLFVDTLHSWEGVGSYPFSPNRMHTVVGTGRKNPEGIASTMTHEIGHNFYLFHTSDCIRKRKFQNGDAPGCKQESVSRSRGQGIFCSLTGQLKCEVNGDGLCDTEADPQLFIGDNVQVTGTGCVFTTSASGDFEDEDHWGDTWTPDVTNVMELADDCRATFTPMQIAVMQITAGNYIPNSFQRVENDFDVFEPNNYPESA